MTKLLSLIFIAGLGTQAMAIGYNCKGIYRQFEGTGKQLDEKVLPLAVVHQDTATLHLEGDLNGRAFVAKISLNDNSALLTISKEPDYRTSVSSRTSFMSGYASTSTIEEEIKYEATQGERGLEVVASPTGVYTLHKIECYAQ